MSMKKYYLAYGSNLNLYSMKMRCPNAVAVSRGVLDNYRLAYKGGDDGYAYLTIEEAEDCQVPVGIFEVTDSDIAKLDYYEEYPVFYEKKYLPIRIRFFKKKALIYVMKDEFSYHVPSDQYVKTCMEGYSHFGFDKKILDEALAYSIENIPKQKKKSKEKEM